MNGAWRGRPSVAARVATYLLLAGAALLWLAPVLVTVVASFKPDALVLPEAGTWRAFVPTDASLANYADATRRVPFWRIMLNSVLINGAIVVVGLVVNSTAAYALARLRWPGRQAVLALVLALLVLPFEAIPVPLFFETTKLGWRDDYLVQILPFVASALSIYLFYTFFKGFPAEVEDAARMDGAGPWRIYLEIVVPQSGAVFAAVTIVTVLLDWGMYLWPLLVTNGPGVRPLPLGIAAFHTLPPVQWGDIMAFAVLMVAPVVLAFLVLQRWFVQGVASTGVRG